MHEQIIQLLCMSIANTAPPDHPLAPPSSYMRYTCVYPLTHAITSHIRSEPQTHSLTPHTLLRVITRLYKSWSPTTRRAQRVKHPLPTWASRGHPTPSFRPAFKTHHTPQFPQATAPPATRLVLACQFSSLDFFSCAPPTRRAV